MVDLTNPRFLRGTSGHKTLTNTKYNLHHHHVFNPVSDVLNTPCGLDFSSNESKKNFYQFRNTMNRRVKRFYDVLNSGVYVYFFRYGFISEEQAIKLRDLFMRKFPNLDFKLVCFYVTGNDIKWKKHDHERIYKFLLDTSKYSLTTRPENCMRHPSFTNLLNTLGIEFDPE